MKAASFIIGDRRGVEPSNVGQGYIARRLIRRAVRYAKSIGLPGNFYVLLIKEIVKIYKDIYRELEAKENYIISVIGKEIEKFEKALEQGLKEFEKGTDPFVLYTTYGFPIELTEELAKEKGMLIDRNKFEEELKEHQELSRTASAGMFKGGLADQGEKTAEYHTATHLMLAALREVLGDHVFQKGSNINAERLRFDFSHNEKMTPEEIKKVEDIVNEKIKKSIPVVCEEMDLKEAKKRGAMGVFESKYGEKVKVYKIGNFSKEICGGPHAENTGDLGRLEIVKEESSSSGVRRIKAILHKE
jgi:alanyl-tRNA synthetase